MPRKEYKTITVKKEVFFRFIKACNAVKAQDKTVDNSNFLESLLDKARSKS